MTGMLDEPAETVDVADAAPPPAASLHAIRTVGTASGAVEVAVVVLNVAIH